MASEKGLEERIEEFCDRVDNIELDIKQLTNSMPESYFVLKPWPQSRKHYLSTISEYCKREVKELPKGFSKKTKEQLKGMYWGVFKEDGKKRYYYRNFLNDYESELANLCRSEGLSEMIKKKDYDSALKALLGEYRYKRIEEKKAGEYMCLIKEACKKKSREPQSILYTISTAELEKKYRAAMELKELMKKNTSHGSN